MIILEQLLRLAGIAVLAYPIYSTHLVFVFFLFAYAPFSKMAHMFYRATGMVFAKYIGRGESAACFRFSKDRCSSP